MFTVRRGCSLLKQSFGGFPQRATLARTWLHLSQILVMNGTTLSGRTACGKQRNEEIVNQPSLVQIYLRLEAVFPNLFLNCNHLARKRFGNLVSSSRLRLPPRPRTANFAWFPLVDPQTSLHRIQHFKWRHARPFSLRPRMPFPRFDAREPLARLKQTLHGFRPARAAHASAQGDISVISGAHEAVETSSPDPLRRHSCCFPSRCYLTDFVSYVTIIAIPTTKTVISAVSLVI